MNGLVSTASSPGAEEMGRAAWTVLLEQHAVCGCRQPAGAAAEATDNHAQH